MRINVKEL